MQKAFTELLNDIIQKKQDTGISEDNYVNIEKVTRILVTIIPYRVLTSIGEY